MTNSVVLVLGIIDVFAAAGKGCDSTRFSNKLLWVSAYFFAFGIIQHGGVRLFIKPNRISKLAAQTNLTRRRPNSQDLLRLQDPSELARLVTCFRDKHPALEIHGWTTSILNVHIFQLLIDSSNQHENASSSRGEGSREDYGRGGLKDLSR